MKRFLTVFLSFLLLFTTVFVSGSRIYAEEEETVLNDQETSELTQETSEEDDSEVLIEKEVLPETAQDPGIQEIEALPKEETADPQDDSGEGLNVEITQNNNGDLIITCNDPDFLNGLAVAMNSEVRDGEYTDSTGDYGHISFIYPPYNVWESGHDIHNRVYKDYDSGYSFTEYPITISGNRLIVTNNSLISYTGLYDGEDLHVELHSVGYDPVFVEDVALKGVRSTDLPEVSVSTDVNGNIIISSEETYLRALTKEWNYDDSDYVRGGSVSLNWEGEDIGDYSGYSFENWIENGRLTEKLHYSEENNCVVIYADTLKECSVPNGEFSLYLQAYKYTGLNYPSIINVTGGARKTPDGVTVAVNDNKDIVISCSDTDYLQAFAYTGDRASVVLESDTYNYWYGANYLDVSDSGVVLSKETLCQTKITDGTYRITLRPYGYDTRYFEGFELSGYVLSVNAEVTADGSSGALIITCNDTDFLKALTQPSINYRDENGYSYTEGGYIVVDYSDSDTSGYFSNSENHYYSDSITQTDYTVSKNKLTISNTVLLNRYIYDTDSATVTMFAVGYPAMTVTDVSIKKTGSTSIPSDVTVNVEDNGDIVIESNNTEWLKALCTPSSDTTNGSQICFVDPNENYIIGIIANNKYSTFYSYSNGKITLDRDTLITNDVMNGDYRLKLRAYKYKCLDYDTVITVTGGVNEKPEGIEARVDENGDLVIYSTVAGNEGYLESVAKWTYVDKSGNATQNGSYVYFYDTDNNFITSKYNYDSKYPNYLVYRNDIRYDAEKNQAVIAREKLDGISGSNCSIRIDAYGYTSWMYDNYVIINGLDFPFITVSSAEMQTGETVHFAVNTDKNVLWFVDDDDLATVDGNGNLTAKKSGIVYLSAQIEGNEYIDTIPVRILSDKVEEIRLFAPSTVVSGTTVVISAEVLPAAAKDKTLNWTSSNSAVATVSAGKVTAKAVTEPSPVTITATAKDGSGVYATFDLTVIPATSTIAINYEGQDYTGKTLPVDPDVTEQLKLDAVTVPAEASDAVNWTSSNVKLATVDTYGNVTIIGTKGTVKITARAADGSGKSAVVTLNIAKLVKSINVSGPNEVAAGKSITLKADVLPTDAANKTLIWESSDTTAATVSSGKVSAKAGSEGKSVTITATAKDGSGVVDTYTVQILKPATGVSVSNGSEDYTGKKLDIDPDITPVLYLSASTEPSDASNAVTWTSSNVKLATVDEDGNVEFVGSKGTVKITAKAADGSGKSAVVTFNIAKKVKALSLSGPEKVAAGKSVTLKADIIPEDAANKTLVWYSDNKDISVSGGKVTAKKDMFGKSVTITAYAKDSLNAEGKYEVFDTFTLTIGDPVTNIYIFNGAVHVTSQKLNIDPEVYPKLYLSVAVEPLEASDEVTWTSSNTKLATVDEEGAVEFLASKGTVKITAKAADGSGKSAVVTLNIAKVIKNITISGPTEVALGKSITLKANILPEDAANKTLVWYSDNKDISVSGGKVTAKKTVENPTAHIQAYAKDTMEVYGEYTVTVKEPVTKVNLFYLGNDVTAQKLDIDPDMTDHLNLSVQTEPEFSSNEMTWTSSNTKLATVDENGHVSIVGVKGTAKITAKAADGSGKSVVVTLNIAKLVKNILISGPTQVAEGKAITLKADVVPEDAANKALIWESSDTSVATVSGGKVTAKKNTAGQSVVITAKAKDGSQVSRSYPVSIHSLVASVVLTDNKGNDLPDGTTIAAVEEEGRKYQLSFHTLPEEAADLVDWSSSDSKIAVVDAFGLVTFTGVKGSVKITATASDGSKKSASVTFVHKVDDGGDVSSEGSVLNICTWNTETWSFLAKYYADEIIDEYTLRKGDVLLKRTTWTSDDGYVNKLDAALARQNSVPDDEKIDIFLAEYDYIRKYTDSNVTADIREMGLTDFSNTYAYAVEAASDKEGRVKGVAVQCSPSAVIYRRSIAQAVLGTSNPAQVQTYIDTWEKFDAVAAQAKELGYYMVATPIDTYRIYSQNASAPWIINNTLNVDPSIVSWLDWSEKYVANGYSATVAGVWDAEKTNQMAGTGTSMCFFGPDWYYNYCMGPAQESSFGDWAICEGPQASFWGGTWMLAAAGTDNPTMVADIMNMFINDQDVCRSLMANEGQFCNNKAVVVGAAADSSFNSEFLGGQNPYSVLSSIADDITVIHQVDETQDLDNYLLAYYREYLTGLETKENALKGFQYTVEACYPGVNRQTTIRFNGNGATSGSMNDLVISDDTALSQNAFSKTVSDTQYNFAGWSLTPNGEVKYADNALYPYSILESGKTITLYAVWTETVPAESLKILQLVSGTLGSYSCEDMVHDGIVRFCNETGSTAVTYELDSDFTDLDTKLEELCESGEYDVIITGYWNMEEYVEQAALAYPDIKFLVFDCTIDFNTYPQLKNNVSSFLMKQNELAFSAGALAAVMTESGEGLTNEDKTIGFVGAAPIIAIEDYLIGYIQGAHYVDPDIRVLYSFVGNWIDTDSAHDVALNMYDKGADVVFAVCAPASFGVCQAAYDADKYAFGVDTDHSAQLQQDHPEWAAHTVSSAIKNFGNAIYDALISVDDETIVWGVNNAYEFDSGYLEMIENGVFNSVVKNGMPEAYAAYEEVVQKLLNKQIEVGTAVGASQDYINAELENAEECNIAVHKKIGVAVYSFDDNFMQKYMQYIREYIDELNNGDSDCIYDVEFVDGQFDKDIQTEQISEFIAQNYDGLIVQPVYTGDTVLADMVQSSGIPTVFINRMYQNYDYDGNMCYVGVDSKDAGTYQGKLVYDLPSHGDIDGDGTVRYFMITGHNPEEGNPNQDGLYRTMYSIQYLTDRGVSVECLYQEPGYWSQDLAESLVAEALYTYENVDVIFCNNDSMALGASQAVRNAEMIVGEDVYIVGIDGLIDAYRAIKQGQMTGTAINDAQGQAVAACDNLITMMHDAAVEEKINYLPYLTVTAGNVSKIFPDQHYDVAFLVDGELNDRGFNQYTYQGVIDYCEEHDLTCTALQPFGSDQRAMNIAFEEAAGNCSADVIVAVGFLWDVALCQEIPKYPDTKVIFLDADDLYNIDYNWDGVDDSLEHTDNLAMINFAEQDAGYMAGYAAVKDGYRSLGFMGGMAVPAVIRYGYGFLEGAEAAAKELGLDEGSVAMKYYYTGMFMEDPTIKTLASQWYEGGTEIIFSCGGSIVNSVLEAAKEGEGRKLIGVDTDEYYTKAPWGEECEPLFVTSAMKDVHNTVYSSLAAAYAGGDDWEFYTANGLQVLGANKGAVMLAPYRSVNWNTLTQVQYNALSGKAAAAHDSIPSNNDGVNGAPIENRYVYLNVDYVDGINTEPSVITFNMSTLFTVPTDEAVQTVEDQLNDYLANTLHENFRVHLVITAIGDYFQQIPTLIENGGADAPDVVQVFSLADMASQGLIIPLDPYLNNQLQETTQMISKIMNCGRVSGLTYMLPRYYGTVLDWKWIYNKDLVDASEVDISQVEDLDSLEDVLEELKVVYLDEHFVVYCNQFDRLNQIYTHTAQVGSYAATVGDSTTLCDYYETDAFRNAVYKAYEFRQKGYADPEGSSNTSSHDTLVMGGSSKGVIMGHSNDCESIAQMFTSQNSYNATFGAVTIGIDNLPTDTLGVGITSTCSDPASAAKFINMLYTDQFVWDTIIYGAEGQDYVWNEDHTKVNYPEGLDFKSIPYNCVYSNGMIGNGFDFALEFEDSTSENNGAYAKYLFNNAWVPPLYGFIPKTDNVTDEISAIQGVLDQYLNNLQYGDVNPDEKYPEFIQALKDAGIDAVIADFQSQANDWLQ